jgi:glycosyltransferase involved in cell wall biosynthesis
MLPNVLIIAYYFPPMGLSGVQRTVKFVKYLPQHGWNPIVLTVTPGGYYAYDESLLQEIDKEGIKIIRTGSNDPTYLYKRGKQVKMPRESLRKLLNRMSQTIFIPDNKIGWRKKAVAKGLEILKNNEIELIFSTAPPFTDHIIGRDLSMKANIPLVLDYRDAWLDYQFAFYPTPLHKFAHYRLEKSCVRTADRIVVVNRPIKIKILEQFKFLHYNDVHIIPQGFDPEDFIFGSDLRPPNTRPMRVTHTGTFIEDITPIPILRALAKLIQEKKELKGRIKLSFAGIFRKEHEKVVTKLGLQENVEVLGYIDHRACTKLMMESDVLFITLGKKKNHIHHTTGKLYDYFGSRKPILAGVPPGIVEQTIKETKAGIVTDPEDIDGLARGLTTYFEQYSREELQPVPESAVGKYNRVDLTKNLAQVFTDVVQRSDITLQT